MTVFTVHPVPSPARRDPAGTVTVVLDGLAFANGVALAADESYVCRVWTGSLHEAAVAAHELA